MTIGAGDCLSHDGLWSWVPAFAGTTAVLVAAASEVICPAGGFAQNAVNPAREKYSCFQKFGFGV